MPPLGRALAFTPVAGREGAASTQPTDLLNGLSGVVGTSSIGDCAKAGPATASTATAARAAFVVGEHKPRGLLLSAHRMSLRLPEPNWNRSPNPGAKGEL